MFLFVIFFSALALAQPTTLTAPWLLVYDAEGRPRWEIRMEKLVRTQAGWEGEGVLVTLFFEGKPTLTLRAPRFSADPLGRRWTLGKGLAGEGQGFTFTAQEARWAERLVLSEFSATGEDLEVVAKEARWELSGTLELFSAEVRALDWTLQFPYGTYEEDRLTAQMVEAMGHGFVFRAEYLELYLREARVKFLGVKVVRRS